MKRSSGIFILLFAFVGCAGHRVSPDSLSDPALRSELFSTIINNHDLMKGFLEEARKSDHAKMMISHIIGDGMEGMDHANCPMQDSQVTATPASKSPYAGEETRAIKSLSDDEIQKYRSGEGMGQAKVAELNHYPGPRHVLQVASQLKLSPEQTTRVQELYDVMHKKAVELGGKLVLREQQLNDAFQEGTIDEGKLRTSLDELGKLQADLRLAHLEAHLGMKHLLSSVQIEKSDKLRGYQQEGMTHQH